MRQIFAALVCVAVTTGTAYSQSNYATVRGSILDPQRHPIPKAHVRIVAEDSGVERDAMSDATGLYGIEHERNTSQLLERFAIERTL
jgi:hypothetical protein